MASERKENRRVIMARAVARRWLKKVATVEYRIRVFYGSRNYKNLPNLLRAFRDGKVIVAGVPIVSDLGIKADFDGIELWSRDFDGLCRLNGWLEKQSFDTTGIW